MWDTCQRCRDMGDVEDLGDVIDVAYLGDVGTYGICERCGK